MRREEAEEVREETQNLVNLRKQNNLNRRSLRSSKAKSVVITEKEKNLLLKHDEKNSPQPSKGFVKSMCRFYSDIIGGDRKKTLLERSASFNARKDTLESVMEGEKEDVSSPVSSRSGSFRLLNRSRSWRESRSSELSDTPKRSSPTGQSVRSQDSGFSDSGENIPAELINASFETSPRETSPAVDDMPFITKIEIEGSSSVQGNFSQTTLGQEQQSSINYIAKGLRTKLDIEPMLSSSSSVAALHRDQRILSPAETPFSSSTPLRASFKRTRPQTMICVEDKSQLQPTPVKRESRTRLKEIKSRRRWSSLEHGNLSPCSPRSQASPLLENMHFGESVVSEAASPAFRSCSRQFKNPEISPVVNNRSTDLQQTQDFGESICVDGTGTRLMVETFLETTTQQERSCLEATTIFPTNSLLLAGIGTDTIIEHETRDVTNESSSLNSSRNQADPVIKWWMELIMSTEPECMTYLQSKPILRGKEASSSVCTTPLAFYPYEMIKTTLVTKRSVLVTMSLLKSHFSALNLLQVNKTIGVLTKQIKDYIYEHNLRLHADPQEAVIKACSELPGFRSSKSNVNDEQRVITEDTHEGFGELVVLQEKCVLQVVDRLRLCAHRCQYTPTQPLVEMKRAVKHLEESFTKFVELVISREVRSVLAIMEKDGVTDSTVIDAINTIISLGNEHSTQVYGVIARVGGVRSLLGLAMQGNGGERGREIQLLSLRGLSSVCCTVEAVRELENCRGMETISRVLTCSATSHAVRVEAAGVLAQITSPWIAENHSIVGLKEEVVGLVDHLTRLARLQAGDDTFLLVSAALANLTFMEPAAVVAMHVHGTATVLMRAIQASPFTSLFARDQVATVLANLAAREECRAAILQQDGLGFLLSLLSTSPGSSPTQAEGAAAERVLKKAAIALSRLCCLASVCEELIAVRGLVPLVRLCKEASSRNYNDAVLVACLAVLRRVANHCGHGIFDSLNARDLIDPKLMDSFLEYSSKQESYV